LSDFVGSMEMAIVLLFAIVNFVEDAVNWAIFQCYLRCAIKCDIVSLTNKIICSGIVNFMYMGKRTFCHHHLKHTIKFSTGGVSFIHVCHPCPASMQSWFTLAMVPKTK
jgi:hypothetical protein